MQFRTLELRYTFQCSSGPSNYAVRFNVVRDHRTLLCVSNAGQDYQTRHMFRCSSGRSYLAALFNAVLDRRTLLSVPMQFRTLELCYALPMQFRTFGTLDIQLYCKITAHLQYKQMHGSVLTPEIFSEPIVFNAPSMKPVNKHLVSLLFSMLPLFRVHKSTHQHQLLMPTGLRFFLCVCLFH